MQKVQKVDSVNIQSNYKSTSNKTTDLYCVLTHSGKVCKGEEWKVWKDDYETISKKWTDKKKTNLFCVFCKNDSTPRKQVQDCPQELLENNTNNNE